MIGLTFAGQLGNQMFRYAAARALGEEKGDKQFLYKFADKNQAILNFNISNGRIVKNDLVLSFGTILQKTLYILFKVLYKFIPVKDRNLIKYPSLLVKNGVCMAGNINDFNLSPALKNDKIFMNGTFENPIYFQKIRSILEKEFTPKHTMLAKNKDFFRIITTTNSVCVSIRRGDFLSTANKGWFDVCKKDYFITAIKKIQELVKDPVFIIFSNDIKWAKENIQIDGDCYYESGDDPVWETLRLMSSCKNFIISNSTFHWWAQYLSKNLNKIVISPNRWYNAPGPYPLILDSFITVEV